ncbi:hypothetical protein GCM10027421_37020 [Microbacterium shaanxiense]
MSYWESATFKMRGAHNRHNPTSANKWIQQIVSSRALHQWHRDTAVLADSGTRTAGLRTMTAPKRSLGISPVDAPRATTAASWRRHAWATSCTSSGVRGRTRQTGSDHSLRPLGIIVRLALQHIRVCRETVGRENGGEISEER